MSKEMKVGDILPFGYKKIQCVEATDEDYLCDGCCGFDNCVLMFEVLGGCSYRKDVIFKIVEE